MIHCISLFEIERIIIIIAGLWYKNILWIYEGKTLNLCRICQRIQLNLKLTLLVMKILPLKVSN